MNVIIALLLDNTGIHIDYVMYTITLHILVSYTCSYSQYSIGICYVSPSIGICYVNPILGGSVGKLGTDQFLGSL